MMKKKFTGAAALGLCLALGISMGASADSRKVVTLGADLTDQQKQIVMNYFGVTSNQVDILTITNQDERDHLGSYVPLEQIAGADRNPHIQLCTGFSDIFRRNPGKDSKPGLGDLQHDRNHPFHFRRCKL